MIFADNFVVGMLYEDVKAMYDDNNISHRIVQKDGKHYIVTRDFKPERRNLVVNDDVVASVSRG